MPPFELNLPGFIDWFIRSALYIPGKPLFFTNGFFLVFLVLFLGSYLLAGNRPERRTAVILFFSMWFYYKSSGPFTGVILLMALFNYAAGVMLGRDGFSMKRQGMIVAVMINVALLALFKYAPFFHHFPGISGLFDAGIGAVAYPVGLSFYTFSNISYLVDVSKKHVEPERSLIAYLSCIAFFPIVQTGPIERPKNLLPQLKATASVTSTDVGEGYFLILNGLIKKMIIGDYVNHHLVMNIFSMPGRYTGMENLAASLGYALVIYCDFSGYTDMARGIARWMGFRIGLNFNYPYKANNIGEFWRRWHISLSSWLRDYLFMPVALRLSSALKREYLIRDRFIRNDLVIFSAASIVTFTVCGIWHGSGLNFLLWGFLHGIALAGQKIWNVKTKPFRMNRSGTWRKINRLTGIVLTFCFVTATWIIFRMPNLTAVSEVFGQIAFQFAPSAFPAFMTAYYPALLMMLCGYLLHFTPETVRDRIRTGIIELSPVWSVLLGGAVLAAAALFQSLGSAQPIYIQF